MSLSSRQLYFLLALVMPVGKIVLMPSQLAYYAQNDLLFPFLINHVFESAFVFFALLTARENLTLFQLLEKRLGKIAAKIIVTFLALFLLYAALLPVLEQKLFVQNIFYDTLPSVAAFAPFFLFAAFLCFQPLSCLGRIYDLLAPLSLVGFVGIFALSFGSADFGALLPVGAAGAKGVFSAAAFSQSWFFDSVILLLFCGRFRYEKGLALKGALCYLLGGLLVLFLLALSYGVFAGLTVTQLFAFSKVSRYFSGVGVLGRVDYFFIYTLALVMAFYVSLPLHAAAQAIKDAYGESKTLSFILAAAIALIMLTVTSALGFRYQSVQNLVTKTLFYLFPVMSALSAAAAILPEKHEKV